MMSPYLDKNRTILWMIYLCNMIYAIKTIPPKKESTNAMMQCCKNSTIYKLLVFEKIDKKIVQSVIGKNRKLGIVEAR